MLFKSLHLFVNHLCLLLKNEHDFETFHDGTSIKNVALQVSCFSAVSRIRLILVLSFQFVRNKFWNGDGL